MTRTTKVMCLPYAGAGAGIYRPWQQSPSERLTAVPIQIPGREAEYTAPFYPTMAAAAAGTADRIRQAAGPDPFVIFGHSFGAVLAYECAQHLLATGGPVPERLIVSGSVSPRLRRPCSISGLSDEQAVADLRAMTGEVTPALEHPQLRALLLPALRADVALIGDYRPSTVTPLPIPITAIRGDHDPAAPADELADWSAFTTASFTALEFSGGHMYLTTRWPELWKILEELS